jgi:hypothetical protein
MAKGGKVQEPNEPNSSLDEMDSSEKNIMMSPEMEQIDIRKNEALEQKIIEEAPQKFVYDKAAAKKRKDQLKGSKKNQIVPSVDLNKAASLNISVRPENPSHKGGLGFSNASLNTNLAKSLPPGWDKVLPKPNSPQKPSFIPQKYSSGQKKKTGQYNSVQVDIEQEMEREFDAKMSSQRREKEMQRTLAEKLELEKYMNLHQKEIDAQKGAIESYSPGKSFDAKGDNSFDMDSSMINMLNVSKDDGPPRKISDYDGKGGMNDAQLEASFNMDSS